MKIIPGYNTRLLRRMKNSVTPGHRSYLLSSPFPEGRVLTQKKKADLLRLVPFLDKEAQPWWKALPTGNREEEKAPKGPPVAADSFIAQLCRGIPAHPRPTGRCPSI